MQSSWGPSESPLQFLDRLRDAMHRHTPLSPGSEVGIQQPVSLFLGQSMGEIRHKFQKIRGAEGRNWKTLLDDTWRVFSNWEEGYKQGMRKFVAVISERERGRSEQRPPRQGPSRLGRDQHAICKKYGHWKNQCPKNQQSNHQKKGDQKKGKVITHVKKGEGEPVNLAPGKPLVIKLKLWGKGKKSGISGWKRGNVFSSE